MRRFSVSTIRAFVPTEAPDYHCVRLYPDVFSPRQCERIIDEAAALTSALGEVGTNGDVMDSDTSIRSSRVTWIPDAEPHGWIYDKLATVVAKANRVYGFDLLGFTEELQFTDYEGPGAFYTWHQDGLDGDLAVRKLSLVVQLTDPDEYEGGELVLLRLRPGNGSVARGTPPSGVRRCVPRLRTPSGHPTDQRSPTITGVLGRRPAVSLRGRQQRQRPSDRTRVSENEARGSVHIMTTITVRKPAFDWPEELPLIPNPDDPQSSCELVGLSFTLPYLEPYLIRTMRVAGKEVDDPALSAEIKAFSGQEAQHYKNHAAINDIVRRQLSEGAASEMRRLEDELEADYRRFTAEKSLPFNLAYAEGFEAMTFAFARSSMRADGGGAGDPTWTELFGWHLAEEIEHRTVTFDAYEAIHGSYPYRLAVGTWAQAHYLGHLLRMATVVYRDSFDPGISTSRVKWQAARRGWATGSLQGTVKAMSPRYNPRNVPISDEVRAITDFFGVDLGQT